MAQNIQDIKRRRRSVENIGHVTNAMRLVSAANLNKAKRAYQRSDEFYRYIKSSIEDIFSNADKVPHKYLEKYKDIKRTCYVIIAGNRGFCGSFNLNVMRMAEEVIDSHPKDNEKPIIIAIGTKVSEYFRKRGYEIYSEYERPPEDISILESRDMILPIIEMYDKGEVDEITIIYNAYVSAVKQETRVTRLLPYSVEDNPEVMHNRYVNFEPSPDVVFNYLIQKYAETSIFATVIESAICEHAARHMAMSNATDNASEMLSELDVSYNRARQAAITNELIEVVSGAEALK